MRRLVILASAAFALALSASSASAQLVFGSRIAGAANGSAFYLNTTTDTATTLWNVTNNKQPNAFAADDVNHRLYVVDSARLSYWNYGTMGTAPTFVSANGGLYRTDATGNLATGTDGLAFANGNLYGWTNAGTTRFSDGIYKITTGGTFAGQMTPQWLNDDVYDFEGLDYNPGDGLFYGTNVRTAAGSAPVGIYSIDALNNPNAVPQFVSAFDSGLPSVTGWDGLAVGDNALWLTRFVNGTLADNSDDRLYISKYSLASNTFVDAYAIALPSGSTVTSGATWAPDALIFVPEPTTLGLAALGLTVVGRRRSR